MCAPILNLCLRLGRCSVWALVVCLSRGPIVQADERPTAQQLRFFETKIRPVLVKQCYSCHSAKAEEIKGGLRLDTRAATRQGGDSGHAVVPGNADASLLVAALKYDGFEMPPQGKLPDDVINGFVRWVQMGAPDPRDGEATQSNESVTRSDLWSLKPILDGEPPAVAHSDWCRSVIDRFVLAKQQAAGLGHVEDADRSTLLRRIYFDLVGLPTPLEELDAFENDDSEQAIARLVDRLLDSPQFGERWARHWLDVARYAESAGNSRDVLMPYAWRYRDYVIDAFNADTPYDQFIREQIAGDLLPADCLQQRDRQTIATGLLAIGSKSLNGGNLELDIADDQIDVVSRAILGLTVTCARCHDHKFDPIPTADYYALAGIFRSTDTLYGGGTKRPQNMGDKLKVYLLLGEVEKDVVAKATKAEQEFGALQKKAAAARKRVDRLARRLPQDWNDRKTDLAPADANLSPADRKVLQQIADYEKAQARADELEVELSQLQASLPRIEFALGVRDAQKIQDWPIQIRGEKSNAGAVVPRGFLSCVDLSASRLVQSKGRSGRLELADWLTHPQHPLTARVLVNRVWQHLFGVGLVRTVDNFGVNGTLPTHPELLDYLAHRFMHVHGWSLKSLIRELVLTRTYQLSSTYDADLYAADAENLCFWRMNRRRMEAEPLRDFVLATSGALDPARPYGSRVMQIGEGELGRKVDLRPLQEPFPHRSVYLPVIRGLVPEFLKLFDLPEPSNVQGQRGVTNVPAQSLFLMNSPFVIGQAEALAKRVLASANGPKARLESVYKICLTRRPTLKEMERSLEFLRRANANAEPLSGVEQTELFVWSTLCQAMFARAEFRYID